MSMAIAIDLLINIILLVSMSVIYSLFEAEAKLNKYVKQFLIGFLVSVVGIVIMYNHVVVEQGIVFDGRSVVMLISGMYFGTLPTIMGALSLSTYRVYIGGAGTIPGVIWVLAPGIIGLYWRNYRFLKDHKDIKIGEQYLVFFATLVLMVVILFLFPNRVSLEAINAVALPLVVFYPLGGLAVSMHILRSRRDYFNNLKIKESELMYNVLFHESSSYGFISDIDTGRIINVNQVAIEKYGYSLDEFRSMTVYDLNSLSKEQVIKIIQEKRENDMDFIQVKHILKSGEIIDVEVRTSTIEISGINYSFANVVDITKRLDDEINFLNMNMRLEATLKSVTDGVIVTNALGNIEIANDVAVQYLSSSKSLIGEKITNIVRIYDQNQDKDFTSIFNFVTKNRTPFSSNKPYTLISNDMDKQYHIDFSLSPIIYNETKSYGTIFVFRDVTLDFEKTNRIEYISQHDFLTGLYNRYFIEVEMKRLDTKRQLPITLIIGDVNGLKLTNDSFGHIEGDNLLKEIGIILKKACRSEDIIARWGGDEFLILLPQTSYDNAQKVIQRITDLSQKSRFDHFIPSISLGVATKTQESQILHSKLLEAEKEMYNNKSLDGKKLRQELLNNIETKILGIHPELGLHSTNVALYCKSYGEFVGLYDDEISLLVHFATYHDIGWITIEEEILLKKDYLDNQEFIKAQEHVEAGHRIMKSIPEYSNIAELILTHHEHYDGTGYPQGLKGKDIPYLSRILAVCDAYDFMINLSIYRTPLTNEEAIQELRDNSGTQFDPEIVEKFIDMLEKFKEKSD